MTGMLRARAEALAREGRKLLQVRRRAAARDLGWLFSGSYLAQAVSAVSAVLMARFYEPEQLGAYFLILAWMGAFAGWGLPGLSSALVTSVARGEEGTFRRSLWLMSLTSLGGSLCLLVVGLLTVNEGDALGMAGYGIAAALYPLYLNDCGRQALIGRQRYRELAVTTMVSRLLALAWVVVMVLLGQPILWILAGNIAILCAINVWLIARSWGHIGPIREASSETIRYGVHLTLSNLLLQPLGQLERIVVGLFFGPADLAVFGVGEMVFRSLKTAGYQTQHFYFPRIASMDDRQVYPYLRRHGLFWTLGFLGLAAIGFVVFPLLYPWLFGSQYEASGLFAALYCLVFALSTPNFFVTVYFRHMRATRETYWYGFVRAPLQLINLALGLLTLGLVGVPISRGVTVTVHGAFGLALARRIDHRLGNGYSLAQKSSEGVRE
jgi:O-antigen/teichoic acid export membrane protein